MLGNKTLPTIPSGCETCDKLFSTSPTINIYVKIKKEKKKKGANFKTTLLLFAKISPPTETWPGRRNVLISGEKVAATTQEESPSGFDSAAAFEGRKKRRCESGGNQPIPKPSRAHANMPPPARNFTFTATNICSPTCFARMSRARGARPQTPTRCTYTCA